MKREFVPDRLDVSAFASDAATLSGRDSVADYPRLSAELAEPSAEVEVNWESVGEERPGSDGAATPWLHLEVDATVPMVCQRCLTPVAVPLVVDRDFRFVADEATAEAEDDDSEEDLLVLARDFDLRSLIEDELLMEIPLTPVHDVCPVPVRLSVADEDFEVAEAAKPNPFAVLGALRSKKPE